MKQTPNFHPRDRELQQKWQDHSRQVPVNSTQYSFDTPEAEQAFVRAQFPSKTEWRRYSWYREEWFRRAKELDPGPAPLAVACELTSLCNLQCKMCYTRTEEFQKTVVGSQRRLPWKIVKTIIDECADLGVPSMLFSWRGEPTLYKENYQGQVYTLPEVLTYARKQGILEITVLTNGRLIDQQMAAALVRSEPSWISFSVDGLEQNYNKIRVAKGNDQSSGFQQVIQAISSIVSLRKLHKQTRPQIRVNTIYPAIAQDPASYYQFMKDIGVDWITVNELLDFRGEKIPEGDILSDWICQYPFQRLIVAANGSIFPCTGAHNEEPSLALGRYPGCPPKDGRAKAPVLPEMTLSQAWTSPKLERIRNLHRQGRRKEIVPGCRYCRHGAKKHGVTWIPPDWDMETMQWTGHKWRIN